MSTAQSQGAGGQNHRQRARWTTRHVAGGLGRLTLAALLGWALYSVLLGRGARDQEDRSTKPPPSPSAVATKARVQTGFGKLPLYFIENRGQVDDRVVYYVQGRDTTLYFTSQGVTFVLSSKEERSQAHATPRPLRSVALGRTPEEEGTPQRWVLKLDFVGATPGVTPRGQEPTPAVISYFRGPHDHWQAGLKTYAQVVYPDLWPGIDLVYSGTATRLKYTFVIRPGADPTQIKLAYRGATEVGLTAAGQLAVSPQWAASGTSARTLIKRWRGSRWRWPQPTLWRPVRSQAHRSTVFWWAATTRAKS